MKPGSLLTTVLMSSLLAFVASNAAASDVRLAQAAKERRQTLVRSLLTQGVDVNARQPDGATALHWASYWDDLETANLLIGSGANAKVADDQGVTPLSLACSNGSAPMVRALLKAGADATAAMWTGETPLMTASRTGNADAVKALLANGAAATINTKATTRGQTALMWAAAEGHGDVIQVLLEHDAQVNDRSKGGWTALLLAARSGSLEAARALISAGAQVNAAAPDGSRPLLVASASGQYAFAAFLIDHGADPNAPDSGGMTPLHAVIGSGEAEFYSGQPLTPEDGALTVAQTGKINLIRALVAHGADPNARLLRPPARVPGQLVELSHLNLTGATPFFLAAKFGEVQLMQALVAGAADPLLRTNDGTTPLMAAAGIGRSEGAGWQTGVPEAALLEAVKLTVALGNDVNATNQLGWTALHGAAMNGADSIIQFLADHGAQIDVKNKAGQTPLDIANSFFNGFAVAVHSSTADLLHKRAGDNGSR